MMSRAEEGILILEELATEEQLIRGGDKLHGNRGKRNHKRNDQGVTPANEICDLTRAKVSQNLPGPWC